MNMFRKNATHTYKSLALAVALAAASGGVAAQDFVFGFNPRTGDAWVDTQLRDMNNYGYRYREPFIDEMVRYHGAPRDLVRDLLINERWAPGDIYYACSIASIIGRPCRYVVDEWEQDHGQGWGVMAKRMGIKPGSAEFHRLKKGFVPTYDRWARPITLDDDLRRAFPDRGKGKAGKVTGGGPKAKGAVSGSGKVKGTAHVDHGGGKAKSSVRVDSGKAKSGKSAGAKSDGGGKGKSGKDNGGKGNGKG
jgi:hypothetical protein